MAEVLLEFGDVVVDAQGRRYAARACGGEVENGTWHGWLEFLDADGGEPLRSGRETTQPNRTDTVYWATGLTPVYLEGALARAQRPPARPAPRPAFDGPADPVFDAPRGDFAEPPGDSILNPYSVYRKGEPLLRRQLAALSVWHLANIVRANGFSDESSSVLNAMPAEALIDTIVSGVKRGEAAGRSRA